MILGNLFIAKDAEVFAEDAEDIFSLRPMRGPQRPQRLTLADVHGTY